MSKSDKILRIILSADWVPKWPALLAVTAVDCITSRLDIRIGDLVTGLPTLDVNTWAGLGKFSSSEMSFEIGELSLDSGDTGSNSGRCVGSSCRTIVGIFLPWAWRVKANPNLSPRLNLDNFGEVGRLFLDEDDERRGRRLSVLLRSEPERRGRGAARTAGQAISKNGDEMSTSGSEGSGLFLPRTCEKARLPR